MMLYVAIALGTLCTSSAAAQGELSEDERRVDAQASFEQATRHYEAGRLDEAIEGFTRAYELAPLPELQYNLYLAHRDAGHRSAAADALRIYLRDAGEIESERRQSLERRLRALEDSHGPAEPNESNPDVPPSAETPPVDDARETAFRRRTRTGAALVSSGGAMLVGSLVSGLLAQGTKSDHDSQCVEQGCGTATNDRLTDEFERRRNAAWVLGVAGGAAAGVGVILLLLRPERSPAVEPAVACSPDGCALTLHSHF
ncbi:MAG: hypothetical protein AAF938_11285 [Myxococcota bacterium]